MSEERKDEKLERIIDGADPAQLDGFRGDLESAEMPDGVSAGRIASEAMAKSGIASASAAPQNGKKIIAGKAAKSRRSAMRRAVLIAASLALILAILIPGAVMLSRRGDVTRGGTDGRYTDTPAAAETDANGKTYKDGVIGERKSASGEGKSGFGGWLDGIIGGKSKSSGGLYGGSMEDGLAYEIAPSEIAPSSPAGKSESAYYGPAGNGTQIRAGTLTAGEHNDLAGENIENWLGMMAGDWSSIAARRGIALPEVYRVRVTSGGNPCAGTRVTLTEGQKDVHTAVTGLDGYAVLLGGKGADGIKLGNGLFPVEKNADGVIELTSEAAGIEVTALDLMLMIDTTGSMGDELEYIKTELSDMVRRVAASDGGGALSIRVSVNFYRDEGDEYIVKYFDFRSDVAECVKQISAQTASGGGDYPEAVHTALDNAVNGHEWRDDAVKLCFFVLDAPPHSESEIQGIDSQIAKSLRNASEAGIRIIPVASSGVDTETEMLLRWFAVMTGGRYIFLTNHSGVGNPHLVPGDIGDYTVETLNECMIRVVCEYCGLEYKAPEKAQ